MTNTLKRAVVLSVTGALVLGTGMVAQASPFCVDEATITDIQAAFATKKLTSKRLVLNYLARIDAYDKQGPKINTVLEINPDALKIAAELDFKRLTPGARPGALYGIPILLKDNIDTADKLHTSAGTLPLANSIAPVDSFVARQLRKAGAIVLGKSNMTEYANFMTVGMPSGYSARGGQVLNPYATAVDANGIPIVTPGGSSSGPGAATAANLTTVAIGTETSGSLLSPGSANGVVAIKPTVGLVSRTGIIPIAASQDTAGPMARTVRDAAIVLGAITGVDPEDPITSTSIGKYYKDYTQFLDPNGLKGARIGVPRDANDPANDVYYSGLNSEQLAIMEGVIAKLKELGATVIEANIPTAGQVGGTGTTTPVLVTNPFSASVGQTVGVSTVLVYEFKKGLNDYLTRLGPDAPIKTLADAIAFNNANPELELRFAQDILLASEATIGDLSEPEYASARALDLQTAKTDGIDAYMDQYDLDAILFPANFGASISAKAGYPSIVVPAGFRTTSGSTTTPPYPFGATFAGLAYSEPTLLKLAYAYEQASRVRQPPATTPPLLNSCAAQYNPR